MTFGEFEERDALIKLVNGSLLGFAYEIDEKLICGFTSLS